MRILFAAVSLLALAQPAYALSPFRECLARTITALDDRISSADAVGAAATEVCYDAIFETRPELRKNPEALDHAVAILKDRATAEVLRARATARPR